VHFDTRELFLTSIAPCIKTPALSDMTYNVFGGTLNLAHSSIAPKPHNPVD